MTNLLTMRLLAVGQRSETVRRANLSAIVRELHDRGPLSRSELVTRTGLTRSAIRGLIGELVAAGLVAEERSLSSGTPGRPSPVVRLASTNAVVLALEISVDSLAAAVVGLGGEVLDLVRVDRPRSHLSLERTVQDLLDVLEQLAPPWREDDRLIGIGVGVAGIVRRSDGFVALAPNLGWRDVALGRQLGEALRLNAPIAIANEADLGALAEHRRGAAVGSDNVLYVAAEVGIGGGLIVDGRPLTGAAGYGGELGHLPVNRDGLACGCGAIGCWETEAAEAALLRRAGHPTDGGRAELDAVLREAASGAPQAVRAVLETGHWLGYGLAGLVNVLNPGLIVLGGLFGRIHPFVAEVIAEELAARALPASRDLVRIVPATLGSDAPLIGAAELAFEPLLADPAGWLRRPTSQPERASA